jgi:hypothetical protein
VNIKDAGSLQHWDMAPDQPVNQENMDVFHSASWILFWQLTLILDFTSCQRQPKALYFLKFQFA